MRPRQCRKNSVMRRRPAGSAGAGIAFETSGSRVTTFESCQMRGLGLCGFGVLRFYGFGEFGFCTSANIVSKFGEHVVVNTKRVRQIWKQYLPKCNNQTRQIHKISKHQTHKGLNPHLTTLDDPLEKPILPSLQYVICLGHSTCLNHRIGRVAQSHIKHIPESKYIRQPP